MTDVYTPTRLFLLSVLAAVVGWVATAPVPGFAQQSAPPPVAPPVTTPAPPAPPSPAAPSGFQSAGIKATITSVTLSDQGKKLVFQLVIQNTRSSGVYLAVVGGWGGSGGVAMANNGAVYRMSDPATTISGISACLGKSRHVMTTTDDNFEFCVKNFDDNNMTMIDAGQSGVLGIVYSLLSGKPATTSDNANFALKFIMRPASDQGTTLTAAASGKTTAASVITISFPLIPLGNQ